MVWRADAKAVLQSYDAKVECKAGMSSTWTCLFSGFAKKNQFGRGSFGAWVCPKQARNLVFRSQNLGFT